MKHLCLPARMDLDSIVGRQGSEVGRLWIIDFFSATMGFPDLNQQQKAASKDSIANTIAFTVQTLEPVEKLTAEALILYIASCRNVGDL